MSTPKYKYSREYVIKKIKSHNLLYSFLKDKKIYNKFVFACIQANDIWYYIDRNSFYSTPFMSFSWKIAELLTPKDKVDWYNIHNEYNSYIVKAHEEI